jgi:predicted methyltransferase
MPVGSYCRRVSILSSRAQNILLALGACAVAALACATARADGTGSADAGRLHRIDEEYARRDFEKHGFVFVRSSEVLGNADDPRTLITYNGEMVGKTDRFVMVFRRS